MEVDPIGPVLLSKFSDNQELNHLFNKTHLILRASPSFSTLEKIKQLGFRVEDEKEQLYSVAINDDNRLHFKKLSEDRIKIITSK
jgi:hypothetical protein